MATFGQIIFRLFILLCCSVFPAVKAYDYCTFGTSWTSVYCDYGCCSLTCCTYSEYYSSTLNTASTAVKAWVIGVIVGGSVLGLIIVVSIIVCIVMACKGSSASRGGVIRPAPQPGVTVISTGGTQATTSTWAQPVYGPTPGGGVYNTTTAYGPIPGGAAYSSTTTYSSTPGVAYNAGPVPPSYSYSDPAYPPAYPPTSTDKPTT